MKPEKIKLTDIDVNFDFTSDCNYWSGFWDRNDGMGAGAVDPDLSSPTLQLYHQALWSKPLPNGDFFDLTFDGGYLSYKGMRLGSDSITVSFRYKKYKEMIDCCMEAFGEEIFRPHIEKYLHRTYTIGGTVLFPRHRNSINQRRGTSPYIIDRWDLTLECIRRYYAGITDEKHNPLAKALVADRAFFDLFVDFYGYCEFFLLQDCVTEDCSAVKMLIPTPEFPVKYPFPDRFERYMSWLAESERFVEARNKRIQAYINSRGEVEKQRIHAEEPFWVIKEQ